MKNFLIPLSLLLMFTLSCAAAEIDGQWTGAISVNNVKLNMTFNFSHDGQNALTCTLDCPDLNLKGIPATVAMPQADKIAIAVPALEAQFNGLLTEEAIDGTISLSGAEQPMKMSRGGVVYNRPQTPCAPFVYVSEEVSFSNANDGFTLSGTLTYPVNYTATEGEKITAVVLISGSGQQNRDSEIMGHKPFLVIADYLARHGIASLRYDDRGVGKSLGELSGITTQSNMEDADAAVQLLKKSGKFSSVGAIGHSEGGSIVFMLGAKKSVDFIISLAGTTVRGDRMLVEQNIVELQQAVLPDSISFGYGEALGKALTYKVEHQWPFNSDEALQQIASQIDTTLPDNLLQNLKVILEIQDPWTNYLIRFDPKEYVSKTTCPVMAVNGQLDTQVISASNLAVVRESLPKGERNLIKEYPSLNHLFQHCTTGSLYEYANIDETFSPEVLGDMVEWIGRL